MSRAPTHRTGKGRKAFRRSEAIPPGGSADALFDVSKTVDQPCPIPHCGAIRLAGQHAAVPTCQHDLDPEHRRRPRGCLNTIDPATTDIPY